MHLPTISGLDYMNIVTESGEKNATSGSQYLELPGFNMLIS